MSEDTTFSPLVMVGGFFAAAFSVYCLQKLYRWLRATRREIRPPLIPIEHQNEVFLTLLRPVFVPLLPAYCRAGETCSFQVIFRNVLKNREYNPQLQNQLLSYLNISIKLQDQQATPSEDVPFVLEEQPITEGSDDVTFLYKFSVKKTGNHELSVRYHNIPLQNTPYIKHFYAGQIDPLSTAFVRKSPAVLCVSSVPTYSLIIEPKDKHQNICQIHDVNLDQFSLIVTEVEEGKKGQLVEPLTYTFEQDRDDWGVAQPRIRLQIELFHAGVFSGEISYGDIVIQNGNFEVICLTQEENDKFRSILLVNPGTVYHEAQLMQVGSEVKSKKRKVYVYVTPHILSVKEFYFGIISSTIAAYHVLPATRVELVSTQEGSDLCTLSFSDRMQSTIILEMGVSNARIVISLFLFFLQQRLGGSETFENKMKFFSQELRKVISEKDRPSTNVVNIIRSSVIESAYRETKYWAAKDWKRKFKILFVGEEGADEGGLRREFLDLICRKMFENNPNGMFRSVSNSRFVLPNCSSTRDSMYTLKHYELAGHVVGKCMLETAIGGYFKQMVHARFGRSFLAQVIGFPPHYKHFELDDPEFFVGKIKYILENDVENMELTFSEEEYDSGGKLLKVVDLIPNGAKIPVTNENKLNYLHWLAQYRLCSQVKAEIQSFIKGLNDIIPFGFLTNFNENELELLMCGRSNISVEDLKNFHTLTPSNEMHCTKIVSWFWIAVESMTEIERAKLLQFTTGSSLLPHGGFQQLEPRFRITVTGTSGKLPIAHTCFSEICLSNHVSYEEFQKSLLTAITEGCEGFSFN